MSTRSSPRLARLRVNWSSRYRALMQWLPATRSPGPSSPAGGGPSKGRKPPLVATTTASRATRPDSSSRLSARPMARSVGRVVVASQVAADADGGHGEIAPRAEVVGGHGLAEGHAVGLRAGWRRLASQHHGSLYAGAMKLPVDIVGTCMRNTVPPPAGSVTELLRFQHREAERALRDVPVGCQDLVADDVGAGTEVPERDRDAVGALGAVHGDRQRDRAAVGGRDADLGQPLLDLAIEAEVETGRRLRELGVADGLGLEDDGVRPGWRRTGGQTGGREQQDAGGAPATGAHRLSASRRAPGRPGARRRPACPASSEPW